jgi:hypothetical protein
MHQAGRHRAPQQPRVRYGVIGAVAAALTVAGTASAAQAQPPSDSTAPASTTGQDPGTTATAATAGPHTVARYTFDARRSDGTFPDMSGSGHSLRAAGTHDATTRMTPRASGSALVFPGTCGGSSCPHLVLQATSAPDLSPGSADLRFGADVMLARSQTTAGQNVVQKGYSSSGGQYKLQIDGTAGRPSCVMVDDGAVTIHIAMSGVTVADGRWHRVECRRSGSQLSVVVDGVTRRTVTIPAALSVDNTLPLSIGGKGPGGNNDQFHGALDDVWITVG